VKPASAPPNVSPTRGLVEFFAVLLIGLFYSRAYFVEAYIVPTGSMAPTLLGAHRGLTCPNCGQTFALGVDKNRQGPQPVCPNCGNAQFQESVTTDAAGDRLLVQKNLFDFRAPRRWEVVVFWNPQSPDEPFVKRIVALSGESIELRDGDVWIDGELARKPLDIQRAMRQLVYDDTHRPADYDRSPRFLFVREGQPSAWKQTANGFERAAEAPSGSIDWLQYQHWRPDRRAPGPISDLVAYDGTDGSGENRVDDLMLTASVAIGPQCDALWIAAQNRGDLFEVELPAGGGPPRVQHNGTPQLVQATGVSIQQSPNGAPRFQQLEVSTFDGQLIVALDGRLVCEPVTWTPSDERPPPFEPRLAVGVAGGGGAVKDIRVYRDVYYTRGLPHSMRRAYAVGEPYKLGSDVFFALGDNSPVSNDSRFWTTGPVVHRADLVGKPFLVHVPSQSIPVGLLGRVLFWIPDFRQIRYIR
jgi:signal peptidase I